MSPHHRSTTLREVAAAAGVSISTVSRALNNQPFVSDAARKRVLDASDQLGYRPDVAARSIRTGVSGAIGLVVSDISNPLFAAVAKAAEQTLNERSFALMIANSANDAAHEAEVMLTFRQRRLDGLLLAAAEEASSGLDERIDAFRAAVLLDREVPGARCDQVLSDHADGLARALRHLVDLGHRRIALVAGTAAQRGSRVRAETYRTRGAEMGLSGLADLLLLDRMDAADGYRALAELLDRGDDRPTAIIAGNNQIFGGLFAAVRDRGVSIPDDLSLIACEETELTALHNPPLDVIRRDMAELGRQAADLVLTRLEEPDAPARTILLPTEFIARGSTGAPRGAR